MNVKLFSISVFSIAFAMVFMFAAPASVNAKGSHIHNYTSGSVLRQAATCDIKTDNPAKTSVSRDLSPSGVNRNTGTSLLSSE